MRRTIQLLIVLIPGLLLAVGGGCRMCYTEYDYTYPAFGGIVSENPCGGRVGSAFCGEEGVAPVQADTMIEAPAQAYYDESGTTSVVRPAPSPGGAGPSLGTNGM